MRTLRLGAIVHLGASLCLMAIVCLPAEARPSVSRAAGLCRIESKALLLLLDEVTGAIAVTDKRNGSRGAHSPSPRRREARSASRWASTTPTRRVAARRSSTTPRHGYTPTLAASPSPRLRMRAAASRHLPQRTRPRACGTCG